MESVEVHIDLQGNNILGGDASALAFVGQGEWKYVSLFDYVENGVAGIQIVTIPLDHFQDNTGVLLDPNQGVTGLHFRFWSEPAITVNIQSVIVQSLDDSNTPTQTLDPTELSTITHTVVPSATHTQVSTSTQVSNPTESIATSTLQPDFDGGLIINGSFESWNGGTLDGWGSRDGVAVSVNSEGNHGTNSLHFSASPNYVSISSWGFGIDSSKSYSWTQYIRTTDGTGQLGFIIDQYDANWGHISGVTYDSITEDVEGSTVSLTYQPTDPNIVNVSVQYFVLNTTFDVWIDSVSFNEMDNAVATVTPTEAPITEVDDATDTPTPDLALPLLWSATDIGAVGIAGSSAFVDNRFVIRGAGTDIWREGNILNDEFYFVYQQMSGDAEFVARITDATHVHEWTKAGIMIRETLQVGSDYVLLADTRDHNTAMQWGFDSSIHDIQQVETPYWLRLTRIGNTFTGYMSTDGNNWMQISQANVEMDQVVSVGLFVTSHDNSQLASASFDNVVVQAIQDNTPSATSVSSSTATYTPTTQPIILIPTQTPLPTIRTCPAGVGPNGITAGDYPPGKLYQNERQWLFAAFGHSGTAPIGYGGEHCGTRVQDASVNFNRWICSNNWEGPGGLELGSYPAGRLTQSQRQWLYESFRNEGTASVGYGGEFCPGDYTSSTQNFFAWVCSQDLTGPEGVVPGSYDAGNLSFSQRQWLWDVFVEAPGETVPVGYGGQHCPGQNGNYDENYIRRARVCSSGATGPYGMIPGNYNVDDLTYEERAWLYDIFE
ncbi:MAG: DUF1349 domain-containing protein, partial [Chloroflexota bacterium]